MATLDRKDVSGLFGLLAIVYLLDSLGSGFIAGGVVFFIVIAALIWFSGQKAGMELLGKEWEKNVEIITRAGAALLLLGVLLLSFYILGLGILVGSVLLFVPFEKLEIDIWSLGVKAMGGSAAKQATRKKR